MSVASRGTVLAAAAAYVMPLGGLALGSVALGILDSVALSFATSHTAELGGLAPVSSALGIVALGVNLSSVAGAVLAREVLDGLALSVAVLDALGNVVLSIATSSVAVLDGVASGSLALSDKFLRIALSGTATKGLPPSLVA